MSIVKGIIVPGIPHPLLCPEKNEGFNLWLTAGRLSQQFSIYCIAPDHVCLNPFLHI